MAPEANSTRCNDCEGAGLVLAPSLESQALETAAMIPCEACGGTGWALTPHALSDGATAT